MNPLLNITREDVISSYEDGQHHTNEYYLALRAKNMGLSLAEIGRRYGESVRSRAKNGSVPRSLKGAEFLEQRKLLPMSLENERVRLFSLLTSIAFWHGTMTPGRATYANLSIRIDSADQKAALLRVLSGLDLPYHNISGQQEIIQVKGSTARLMNLMGYNFGAKKDNDRPVPDYILGIHEAIKEGRMPSETEAMGREVLADFAKTLLFYRGYVEKTVRMNLNTFNSEQSAREQGEFVLDLLNQELPDNPKNLRLCQHGSTGTYYGVLSVQKFTEQQIQSAESFRNLITSIVTAK